MKKTTVMSARRRCKVEKDYSNIDRSRMLCINDYLMDHSN